MLNIYFASVNSGFFPLQYPLKSFQEAGLLFFPKYYSLFGHLLICFSHADGNLGSEVASLLRDLSFCLRLVCCQVSTTLFRKPALSLGF